MTRANYCEFFRFHDRYCDVFIEDGHYLFAECEPYYMRHPFACSCREYRPAGLSDLDGALFNPAVTNIGFIVSDYAGADPEYLHELEPAPVEIARAIIASEERYTLECMAGEYGYTREYVLECYREQVDDGNDTHEAFMYVAGCMMERDL